MGDKPPGRGHNPRMQLAIARRGSLSRRTALWLAILAAVATAWFVSPPPVAQAAVCAGTTVSPSSSTLLGFFDPSDDDVQPPLGAVGAPRYQAFQFWQGNDNPKYDAITQTYTIF